jgi:hypothetical protein
VYPKVNLKKEAGNQKLCLLNLRFCKNEEENQRLLSPQPNQNLYQQIKRRRRSSEKNHPSKGNVKEEKE